MTQINEMARNLAAAIHIIMINGVAKVFSRLIVDHNDGEPVFKKMPSLCCSKRGGTDDDAIDPVFHHGLDDPALPIWITLRGGDEQAEIAFLGCFFNALQNLAEEWVIKTADDDSQDT